ncbi:MAG: S-adenosylmethionine synthetase N-terminal domain-containing protein, partial [Candidatus Phytoplasma australasiaticum]|nr:S-adenosylmethionine synthetase N-terminal domain-containing protein [Candidatus Phytoplasma australasiaticum]
MQKFTVESVTQGHPDKIADQISDVLLDAYLKQYSNAKVALETRVTKNKIILCGEIKSSINL